MSIGAPEREVHVQRFAREQLQVEYEEYKIKVAEQQQRYERDIRLAQSNLTTRAGADGSTKESMREQLLSLRATVADLRATNSKLTSENAAQAAKLASIESGAPITDMEVGDFDSPFFRGAPKSKSSKSRDVLNQSQVSSALPSARYVPLNAQLFRSQTLNANLCPDPTMQISHVTLTTMIHYSILTCLRPNAPPPPPPPLPPHPSPPCGVERLCKRLLHSTTPPKSTPRFPVARLQSKTRHRPSPLLSPLPLPLPLPLPS